MDCSRIFSPSFAALDAYHKQLTDDLAAQVLMDAPPGKPSQKNVPKSKAEAGTKRKAGSQGVEKLKKASTTGMNKMSSFFKPK